MTDHGGFSGPVPPGSPPPGHVAPAPPSPDADADTDADAGKPNVSQPSVSQPTVSQPSVSQPAGGPPPTEAQAIEPPPNESAPTEAIDPVPPAQAAGAGDPRPAGPEAAPGQPPLASQPGHYTGRRRAPKVAKKQKPRRKAPWWELPGLVLLAILIAILVKTFIVQPFYIPSESMEKTLHGCSGCHGDRILVNKVIYDFRDPHPGDIVVFNAPPGWDSEATTKPPGNPIVKTIRGFGQLIGFVPPDGQVLVKRVIATAGQTVKSDAQGHVMVSTTGPNGPFRTLHEPYIYMPGPSTPRPFGAVTVPKGRLWVMGDHRNDSADSRYHCGPNASDAAEDNNCDPKSSTVPVGDVIGKAFVIAWPPSRWRTLGTPSTFKSAAMAGASGVPAFVSGALVLPVVAVRRRRRR